MCAAKSAANPTQSFVVRIWIEESGGRPTWRGYVTHVQSGDQCAFEDLACVHRFLARHLAMAGVRPSALDRMRLYIMSMVRR